MLDRRVNALTEAGCIRILADKRSGKNAEREELWRALDFLREGDTLIVSGLRKRGVGFTSLHEALDTTTPGGRLVFHVFAALAEFIRELIVQGTNEGLDAARDLLARPENTVTSIAKLLGVPEPKGGRLALAESANAAELPRPSRPKD